MPKDPICGMDVSENGPFKINQDGQTYFFCSKHCRDKFLGHSLSETDATCCSAPGKPLYLNKLFIIACLILILILLSFLFPVLAAFRNAFVSYLKSVWWAIIFGLLLGGVIDYYIPREYISKILAQKKPSTIINAVFLGFFMSACSHGILALSIQLHKKGASGPAVVSFLLASPWANFAVTMMLLSLFGIKGLVIVLAAIIIAINTGFVFMLLEKKGLIEKNKNRIDIPQGYSIIQDAKSRIKNYKFNFSKDSRGVLEGALALSDMVLWWILLGIFIASLIAAYIPKHFMHNFMGPTFLGLLATLFLATIIEVCSEGSSPLAFEIYRQTAALGNAFTFLMAGVVTDYTEIGLLWTNVGRRTALWMPVVTVPQVLIAAYFMNMLLK